MSNRIELGGFYPSKGEQSFGELRARYYVEYSNALSQKINEIWANNPDSFDNPREVLAAAVAGDLDDELMKDNEVHPEEYEKFSLAIFRLSGICHIHQAILVKITDVNNGVVQRAKCFIFRKCVICVVQV